MRKKTYRVFPTSALTATLLLTGTPALAFDEVHWEWSKFIDEYIDKDIRVDVTFEPTGMLELQDLQVSVGDISANSIITPGDPGNPGGPDDPGGPGGPGDPNGNLTRDISNVVYYFKTDSGDLYELKLEYDQDDGGIRDASQPADAIEAVEMIAEDMWGTGEVIGYTTKGGANEFADVFFSHVDLIEAEGSPRVFSGVDAEYDYDPFSGKITNNGTLVKVVDEKAGPSVAASNNLLPDFNGPTVPAPEIEGYAVVNVPHARGLDATLHLPEVDSIATAVANNASVVSDVMIEMHDTQVAFGGFAQGIDAEAAERVGAVFTTFYQPDQSGDNPTDEAGASGDYTGNIGVAGALALIVAGAEGLITPGNVTAVSNVDGVLNASVNSDATAVANNKSVALNAATPGDAVFIGDLTQFAYMDVAATSNVRRVSVAGYTGLGRLGRPLVSSVVTAVGNNLSVDVSTPGATE